MLITRRRAVLIGIAAIACVVALQAFNSFACYRHDLLEFLSVTGMFLALPLLPALASLVTANPLRAAGACLGVAPWLMIAYYVDCVRPYAGGGASMIYVAVVLWGTPCAILGALVSGPVLRACGISVGKR